MGPALAADPHNAPLPQPPSNSAILQHRDSNGNIASKLILSETEQQLVDNTVDLGGLEVTPERRAELVKQVCALAEAGLMFVKNSGVEPELVAQLHAVSREFFSWPAEEKRKLQSATKNRSARPQGYFSKFSTFNPSAGEEAQEPFAAFREQFRTHVYPEYARAESVWPSEKFPEMQATFQKYLDAVRRAGEFLLGLLMEGLGLPPTYLLDKYLELGVEHKAIHTPVQIVGQKPAPGIISHTDPCLCNFDAADGVRGLQFFVDGEWLTIPPLRDVILFSVGDDLETISNGRYHSPTHRALTATEPRISQATPLGVPNDDTVIGPAEELIDSLHPARYRTRRARERIGQLTSGLRLSVEEDRTKKHIFIDFDSDAEKSKNLYVFHGQTFLNGVPLEDWGATMPASAA